MYRLYKSKKVLPMNAGIISEIRDRVNKSNFRVKSQRLDWDSLCAAMDIVSDMDEVFGAFQNETENENEKTLSNGQKYLRFYGVMECLHVQQDAVAKICNILKLKLKSPASPMIRKIRTLRNQIFTHPYDQKNGENNTTSSIIRSSMTKNEFLVSKDIINERERDKSYIEETINIEGLIKLQRESLSST